MQKFPIIAMESQGMPCHCQTRISNVRRSAGKLEGGDSDKTVPIANLYKKLEPVLVVETGAIKNLKKESGLGLEYTGVEYNRVHRVH